MVVISSMVIFLQSSVKNICIANLDGDPMNLPMFFDKPHTHFVTHPGCPQGAIVKGPGHQKRNRTGEPVLQIELMNCVC